MNCEIVAVGTELLLGQIVDTNSAWMGEQLAELGIDSYHQTKVGDNMERMCEVISQAVKRSDAVIVCGGLGPTQDDITRESLAKIMGVDLVLNEAAAERITAIFTDRGLAMPRNNLRQAMVPRGAQVSPIIPGTAPGLLCFISAGAGSFDDATGTIDAAGGSVDVAAVPPLSNTPAFEHQPTPATLSLSTTPTVIYAVPGVPWEMKVLMEEWVLPDLSRRAGIRQVIASRVLRTWGDSESSLSQRLEADIQRLDKQGHATIAFLASSIDGLKVRITAKANSKAAVDEVLDAEEKLLRQSIGEDLVFGVDDETMESAVLALCRNKGMTLAVAESLTGGLVSARLTSVPGASDVFKGGVVSYAPEVKFNMLGVSEGKVVSVAVAEQMALGVCELLGTDCAVATTGVAGPDSLEGHPPGTVCFATAVRGETEGHQVEMPFAREQVQLFSVLTVLNQLRRRLLAN